MQHYDVRLKAILHRAMPRLFRLLGLPVEVAEYLTVEFPLHQKVLPDSVVRSVDGRIIQIELQSKNDPRMLWRSLEYYQAIAELWPGAPAIIQVVIYLGEGPMNMVAEIGRDRLTFAYEILCLQDVAASEFLESESDDERILAVLGESADPRATIRAILASWRHLPAAALSEKLLDLQVLSQLRNRDIIVKEETSTMPIEIDFTQNAMFKWGEEVGEAKGEAKGEARFFSKILERRFGALPDSLKTRIGSASIQSLDRWADRLDVAATLDEVFAD